jgi:hypothetical protein
MIEFKFPSPCGEKVENYLEEHDDKYGGWHCNVSVPLRGKGRKLPLNKLNSSAGRRLFLCFRPLAGKR